MTAPSIDRATEIERLAALESIDYEVVRVDEAKRLGIRSGILDQEVAKKRRALGLEGTDGDPRQGRAVKILDIAMARSGRRRSCCGSSQGND
jgi:hypothetical protein